MSAVVNAFVYLRRFARSTSSVPEELITVTCPMCASRMAVHGEPDGLSVPDVKCGCGTLINSNFSYFSNL